MYNLASEPPVLEKLATCGGVQHLQQLGRLVRGESARHTAETIRHIRKYGRPSPARPSSARPARSDDNAPGLSRANSFGRLRSGGGAESIAAGLGKAIVRVASFGRTNSFRRGKSKLAQENDSAANIEPLMASS